MGLLEGTFQAQEEATLRIGALSLLSLAMVFVVLFSRYQSSVLTLIIISNVPLALIGSVIALNIAGQPLSVASMIGFITLAGISIRNGILKVSHYINLALYEGEQFGKHLVIRGSLERLARVRRHSHEDVRSHRRPRRASRPGFDPGSGRSPAAPPGRHGRAPDPGAAPDARSARKAAGPNAPRSGADGADDAEHARTVPDHDAEHAAELHGHDAADDAGRHDGR